MSSNSRVPSFSPNSSTFCPDPGRCAWGLATAWSPWSIGVWGPWCCRLLSRFGSPSGKLETNPFRGYGAVGSASAWHAEGQGFESPYLHEIQKAPDIASGAFCVPGGGHVQAQRIARYPRIANHGAQPSHQRDRSRFAGLAVIPAVKTGTSPRICLGSRRRIRIGIADSGQQQGNGPEAEDRIDQCQPCMREKSQRADQARCRQSR